MFFLPQHSGLAIVHLRGCTDSAAWCSSLRELHLIWHKLSCWQLLPAPGDDSWQLGPALDSSSCGRAARPSLQPAWVQWRPGRVTTNPCQFGSGSGFQFQLPKNILYISSELIFCSSTIYFLSAHETHRTALPRHGAQSFVYSVEQRARAWVKNDQLTQSLHCLGCRQETLRSLIFKI